MTLDEEIKNKFLADTDTILEAHLEDLEGMFQFHQDGSIELLDEYRKVRPEDRILVYLIAKRYQFEAGLTEDDTIPYSEIYALFPDKERSTVRGYFMNLRKEGFALKNADGHELIAERLPDAIERIESNIGGD